MISFLFSLHVRKQDSGKFIFRICCYHLRSPVQFQIPEIFPIKLQQYFTVHIPVEVHARNGKCNGLSVIFLNSLISKFIKRSSIKWCFNKKGPDPAEGLSLFKRGLAPFVPFVLRKQGTRLAG